MTLLTHSFLISFMVDARGGAMKGRRHSGIRIIIPPNRASMPTRVTCRLIKKDKLIHPIPIGEGEALAARIIEMGPVATKFLGRILIEIPHFASLRGKEREIKIMRSTNGDKWEEHPIVATDDAVQKALSESMEDLDYEDELAGKRVTRILTDDFPRYFALVTKVREEKQWVGEEGLILSSTVVPQVQAVFPKGAVNKNIKVGLQAQPVSPELVSKLLGNRVAVSPIVTLEPRRRRFHTAITLTIPVPKAAQKGMINQYENEAPTLRVMYSIAASNNALREGTNPALWDDLTDQTQLTFIDDCVSFNTNVSGRFMLMDCQNVADACRFATELYREAIIVPYMARFVVFAKRTGEEEGKLRMFCMTDDRIDKTLEKQENFREVARSRDVEVLEGRPQYVEMAGNLIPITKSGDQLYISFKAFRENRLPCLVKIRDRDQEPAARVAFMKEPKVVRGELPQTPICNLNIALPDMSTSSSMEMDPEAALELKKRSSLLREHGIVVEDTVTKAKINLSDVADTLKGDWVILATQLDISGDEIHKINSDYRTVNDQALAMLSLWKEKKGEQATGNELERALRSIKREDVVQKCMYNVECITDEVELAAAKVAMDQSGFDTFAEEIGATQDSMKRNMSLDVQFDEQEVQKLSDSEESESVADSPASAPQAYEEDSAQSPFKDDLLVAEVSERRALAKEPELPEKKKEDFFDLIDKLDKYNEIKEKQERSESSADTGGMDDSQTITEEELTSTKQEKPKSEEIIAKVEELGQNLAPAPAPEPTEDEEGTKTPPPSPVEGEFVSEEVRAQQAAVNELAARLSTAEETAEHPGETVIDSELVEEEESTVEQVLTDGSKVTRKRFKSGDSIKSENGEPECMELVEEEGPEKEDVKYEENEEILEDGTVHRISRTRRQSLKHVKRTLISESGEEENIFDDDVAVPGKAKEDVIEVFEEPAKPVTQVEEVEVIKNDGRVVKKRMVMNRMVSNVKTFHQSFDDSGNLQEDEYEIEAIIPGTESAFVEGEDTTSSSSSGSSSDDNDENDEEIDVDDLDLVEEDCQSGTTVTSRQVIKQTFTSTTYETDEPKELDETGLVKRIVKKVTYDPKQPEVVCDSSEYDDEVVLAIETPLITITEDNSKPANEGDDHLAYFGYRCSQESLKEEENSKSVAEIVHMFEKDSQKQNAAKPDIVQISDSDELSEGKVSNIKEQSAMYFAEKEIIIVEKNKSEALTESQNEYTQDDTKPIKVHRMVEIFEKISSQSSVDETGVERQLPVLYDNSNVGFESMSEQNKDIEAEKTQSVDEVDEQELEILGESEETITKNQMREPETQQEMKKPDELKYTNISQEFGIVEETTSPLVIETVSPVAKIVEDIESNVSRIQEATIKEQVVPTEQVTEVHTKDLEPQYLSSSDEIYYEKIVNVSEETQFADEIASSTEEMLEEFEQCYPNKMNATETVENEEKLSSEKDISPECEQQSVVEDICDQNEVSEAAKETLEPTCLSSLSIQIVEQHSDEQLIEEENEMTISKTEVQKISPTSNLEDFSAIESRSDDIETIKYPHTDKEFPPKHDGELSVEETGNKIRTETTGETSIINDFQIVHTLTEISNEQQKEEKHDTMENQDSDTSFEYPLTLQSNEEHDARETRPETHLQQMSVSHDEYEFIDDTNERLPKDVDEIKCVDDEGDEDWELLDKEEIEEALNYPDKEISYSDVGSSEQAFNISSEHPRPCIPVVDMNSESEDDISDDTTEIADRSETCDIESPIEFKQPFEKFEEVSEPKTVQFDNKVLEVKSTSTGIESSVETRDIAKESVTSIEEEDIESISSTEEYKIRKYEYDQEIKEKDTIAKQQAIHLTRLK
uniref:Ankyrin-2-like isoform X23 n=1 Tax=Crassostrea virginica TaxID=6565 RepID=A0A8B8CVA1_CRAVI|nr:ankyrin-2-like isoform X23 [Crassostrea virginica]